MEPTLITFVTCKADRIMKACMMPILKTIAISGEAFSARSAVELRAFSISPVVLFTFACAAFSEPDGKPVDEYDSQAARAYYETELWLFSEASSQAIQSLADRYEEVFAAMDANPVGGKRILEEVSSRKELQSAIDNPEWLHGIDVVVEHGHSEDPSVGVVQSSPVPGRTDVWIVGWDGLILHSQNDGYTWEVQETGVAAHLQAVDFVDPEFGVAVGRDGMILKTEDGGASWKQSATGGDVDYYAVDCISRERCFVVGDFPAVLETTDGATTWTQNRPAPFRNAAAIKMISEDVGLTAGSEIWRTSDGGKNWHKVFPAGFLDALLWTGSFTALTTADAENLWAVGRDGKGISIYRSIDAGESWHSQTENIDPDAVLKFDDPTQSNAHRATAVFAQSADRGYVGATNGVILATVDGGAHWWAQMATGTSTVSIHGISMRDGRVGWAIGNLGHVFATNSGGGSWIPVRGPAYLFWTLVETELELVPDNPLPD